MQDIFVLIFRCILFYLLIIIALRVMGKREVGELSVLDIVIYFVMSELLALSISDLSEPPYKAIIAIGVLVVLQLSVSLVCIKSKRIRDFFEGKPALIIDQGKLNQKTMLKQRYTIDDLMYQLRSAGVSTVDEVQFALLENSGTLTVLSKKECNLNYPFPLISDGKIQKKHLDEIGKDEQWLIQECGKQKKKISEVFLALWTKNGLFLIEKEGKAGLSVKKCRCQRGKNHGNRCS